MRSSVSLERNLHAVVRPASSLFHALRACFESFTTKSDPKDPSPFRKDANASFKRSMSVDSVAQDFDVRSLLL